MGLGWFTAGSPLSRQVSVLKKVGHTVWRKKKDNIKQNMMIPEADKRIGSLLSSNLGGLPMVQATRNNPLAMATYDKLKANI